MFREFCMHNLKQNLQHCHRSKNNPRRTNYCFLIGESALLGMRILVVQWLFQLIVIFRLFDMASFNLEINRDNATEPQNTTQYWCWKMATFILTIFLKVGYSRLLSFLLQCMTFHSNTRISSLHKYFANGFKSNLKL